MKALIFTLGIIIALIVWYNPLKRAINGYIFWMLAQRLNGKSTEYFRNSPYWKIEATNEGLLKDWFGPYRFNSYGFTFYIYCKTDDVSKYKNDLKNYKVE